MRIFKMQNAKEPKIINTSVWRCVLILLLIAGLFTSCELSTGLDDDNGLDSDSTMAAAEITSFTASDDQVSAGETVTLSWEVAGDNPITLTLEPGDIDLSGETSTEVTPEEETTYRLTAENEAGSDEAEVTVDVTTESGTTSGISITGLPDEAAANIAITDHNSVMQWVTDSRALSGLAPATYTVAAGVVQASGTSYLPDEDVQTITFGEGENVDIQVNYSEASGNLFETEPDVGACNEGALTTQAKERGLMSLNFIRALAGLPPVSYDSGDDEIVQKASLMFAANVEIDHTPPESWHCYSDEGADGAGQSNIAVGSGSVLPEDFITLWADDKGVPNLGHRRWLLDPFLPDVALGLVEGTPQTGDFSQATGSAIRVISGQDADISEISLPFVAYPRGEFPTRLLSKNWFMSFSVLADHDEKFNNSSSQIDFSGVEISVENESGSDLSVTEVNAAYTNYGLPNQLKWKVPGMEDNVEYTVTITGVIVNGESKDYSYTVNLK